MDDLGKCMFIIFETIVNIEHGDLTCFKVYRCFSKNLFMSISLMKKEIPGSHYFSFFALSNLLTQTCLLFCRTRKLTTSEHAKYTKPISFIIVFVSLSVHTYCTHTYFDAAKFSIILFSFLYILLVLLSDNGMNMK